MRMIARSSFCQWARAPISTPTGAGPHAARREGTTQSHRHCVQMHFQGLPLPFRGSSILACSTEVPLLGSTRADKRMLKKLSQQLLALSCVYRASNLCQTAYGVRLARPTKTRLAHSQTDRQTYRHTAYRQADRQTYPQTYFFRGIVLTQIAKLGCREGDNSAARGKCDGPFFVGRMASVLTRVSIAGILLVTTASRLKAASAHCDVTILVL